jgi:hypothetical protein
VAALPRVKIHKHTAAHDGADSPVPAEGEAREWSRVRPVVSFRWAVLDGRKHPHKPAAAGARDRVACRTTDDDWLLLASPPRRQHADEQAHAERDANGLIRMLADNFVGGLRGGDGLFLQALENLFGLIGCGFQFCSKFALLAVSMLCCFHALFLSGFTLAPSAGVSNSSFCDWCDGTASGEIGVADDRVGDGHAAADARVDAPGGAGCPPSGLDAVDGTYKRPDVSL